MDTLHPRLELDSQVELLDRLQLLTHYCSNIILLRGEQGSGKSWLIQRYLETKASDLNQSLLYCHANQEYRQHRKTIIQQLFPEAPLSPSLSLLEIFEQQLEQNAAQIVIIIDDAHLISDELLAELWQVILTAQHNDTWLVNVILASHQLGSAKDNLSPSLQRMSYGQELKPMRVDVETLPQVEAELFLEQQVMRYVEDEREKQVRREFAVTPSLPGHLLALKDLKVRRRIVIQGMVGSPIKVLSVLAVLSACVIAGYWWLFYHNDLSHMPNSQPEAVVLNTTKPLNAGAVTTIPEQKRTTPEYESVDSLPPPVMSQTKTVESKPQGSQERIVIDADIVDALVAKQTKPIPTTPAVKLDTTLPKVNQPQVKDVERNPSVAIDKQPTLESKPLVEPSNNPKRVNSDTSLALSPEALYFQRSHEEIASWPTKDYTLQLAALTSYSEAMAFIKLYQLNDVAYVYTTQRNDKTWFIVIHQHYANVTLARKAKQKLPIKLQKQQPWIKSLKKIQSEMTPLK